MPFIDLNQFSAVWLSSDVDEWRVVREEGLRLSGWIEEVQQMGGLGAERYVSVGNIGGSHKGIARFQDDPLGPALQTYGASEEIEKLVLANVDMQFGTQAGRRVYLKKGIPFANVFSGNLG